MSCETEYNYYYLLLLFMFATCFFPSVVAAESEAQVLINFKSFLSNTHALNSWGNNSIPLCSWNGLLCINNQTVLHGLRLENMNLSGTINIDILLQLSTLKSFSVINNSFEGPMPEFKKLVGLRALFLSNNKFSGEIPNDAFEGLKQLKRVFLTQNGFTGHIPISLAQLPRLLDVDLHDNRFDGNIPEFQKSDFRVFNLSNNQLEGPIPDNLSNKDPSSFAGNIGLCGKALNLTCRRSPPVLSVPHEENEHRKHHHAFISILVFVIVVVLASILALVYIRYRRRQTAKRPPATTTKVDSTQSQFHNTSTSVVSIEGTKSIEVAVEEVLSGESKVDGGDLNFVNNERVAFDLQDLLRASAEVLGSGSFGSTYKAMVLTGPVVVVKRFKHMNSVGKEEFIDHMRKLGRLKHPNLLPLVAFYYGKEEKLLIQDFVQNGSLASHLHRRSGGDELDWATRLKIIKGVARGLAYLYKEFPDADDDDDEKVPRHGHLKSSNVMLNSSLDPLLTEYGLAKVIEKKHAHQFMAGFKSPEVSQSQNETGEATPPSEKSDVWCLGILILEVLTGKFPANYLRHGKQQEGGEDLATWVESIVREGWSGDVLDKNIGGSRDGEGEMLKLLRIGMGCCESSLENRWTWTEAVAKIEEIKERDNNNIIGFGVEDQTQQQLHLYSSSTISTTSESA